MSKAVRWTIPFESLGGTNYRIDIYDEGYAGNPVQLLGGPHPLVTDENNSDDFFTSARTHTGSLQVCTEIPGGGTLALSDILPENNISRPVRLINLSNSNAIEWQGFLSCEAYSQEYTSAPQILTLSVISVLEAMASVPISQTAATGIKAIRLQIYNAIRTIENLVGMPSGLFTVICYSRTASNIMLKNIDSTILYDVNEYNNETSSNYVVEGLNCLEVLNRICAFMGWIVRDQGQQIFFQRVGEELSMYAQSLTNFGGTLQQFYTRTDMPLVSKDLSTMTWMGARHERSIMQGARSVEVIANLIRYEMELGLPAFPTENMIYNDGAVIESYVTLQNDYNNMLAFAYYVVTIGNAGTHISVQGDSTVEAAYGDCVLNPACDVATQYKNWANGGAYDLTKNVGAFNAKLHFEDEYADGLYIVALNELNATGEHAPTVFTMRSILSYRLIDGSLKFKMTGLTITDIGTEILPFMGKVEVLLQFGSLYWNGSAWQAARTYFLADFTQHESEDQQAGDYVLTIPVGSQLQGEVIVEVRGSIQGGTSFPNYYQPFYDLFLSELSVTYEAPEYVTESDRTANHYFRLLGTNFRDDIKINADLASNLNNQPSPSLIIESGNNMLRELNYIVQGGSTERRRPEVDLLNRMAAYYSEARQQLKIEVAHPTDAPLPCLVLNGINDGKKYLPLAESREWADDKSTLTCFETVNE